MAELNYSKKQIQPLIDKYAINAETNTTFARIINMFDGQPNYQLWGVKVVFSKAVKIEELEAIKNWANKNPELIKKLSKNGNIICYSKPGDFDALRSEMEGLSNISFVKDMISRFNTDQRKALSKEIEPDKLNGVTCHKNSKFRKWFELFSKFNRLSGPTKTKVIGRMSAERDIKNIETLLNQALKEKYDWNKEDLMSFIANNTPKCEVIFDDKDIVLIEVKNYNDSNTLCYGRTSWCITSSDGQWNNYVVSKKSKQYFLFDFSKAEKDELAHVAFTVNDANGITNAHSTSDACLMNGGISYHGKNVNIQKVLLDDGINLGLFLKLKKNSKFGWSFEDFCKYAETHKNLMAIAYSKDNRVIVNVLTNEGFANLVSHSFIKHASMPIDSNHKCYVLLDFNLKENDDKSIVAVYYAKDTYKIDTLNQVWDAYGTNLKDEQYLTKIGIMTDEYMNREDIDPNILLHKFIDEGNVEEACSLLDKNNNIDVNYEFNDKRPIFNAIDKKMHKLIGKIIANKNFDSNIEDGFGESLLQNLMYVFYLDEIHKLDKSNANNVQEMIETMIDSGKFDLNHVDWNEDTAINIACTNPNMLWIVKKLAKNPKVDVNHVNDIEWAALGNAIRKRNLEALKVIGKRPDLEVRDKDRELAEKLGIDLKKYIKPEPFAEVTETTVATSESVVTTEAEDADKYNELFKKVFAS